MVTIEVLGRTIRLLPLHLFEALEPNFAELTLGNLTLTSIQFNLI
jgi:hypothetical protein